MNDEELREVERLDADNEATIFPDKCKRFLLGIIRKLHCKLAVAEKDYRALGYGDGQHAMKVRALDCFDGLDADRAMICGVVERRINELEIKEKEQ